MISPVMLVDERGVVMPCPATQKQERNTSAKPDCGQPSFERDLWATPELARLGAMLKGAQR